MPTPPPAAAMLLSKDKEAHSSPPVPTLRQAPGRSNSHDSRRHRPDSPRNYKELRKGGEELIIEISRREEERSTLLPTPNTPSVLSAKISVLNKVTGFYDTWVRKNSVIGEDLSKTFQGVWVKERTNKGHVHHCRLNRPGHDSIPSSCAY